jgi:dihydrofolate synthase / folylpolyglutamate synthase
MTTLPEIEFLQKLTDFGIKLGLDKTRNLLEAFGNPHLKYPSVLIAGTNGKGSVAKTLAHILTIAGYRTGLYTSPHLVYIGERIILNGDPISERRLAFKIRQLQKILGSQPYHLYPTFFEALTVIAFSFFADVNADIVICEVGMGGRFDATNVLPASLEIITKIGLEHTKFLGKTYHEIAGEKAGIIKPGSTVISTMQKEDAMRVIKNKAKGEKAKIYIYREHFRVRRTAVSVCGQEFNFYSGKERFLSLKTPLLGIHQMENMALAVQSVRLLDRVGFPLSMDVLYKGMATVVWPCRFQVIKKNPVIVIDGAHNPDGIRTLYKTLRDVFPEQKFSFLTGILKDKDWQRMLRMLLRNSRVDEMVFTRPDTNRAVDPEILAGFVKSNRKIKVTVTPEPSAAFKYINKTKKNWCICGSLYLCGDILSLIQK